MNKKIIDKEKIIEETLFKKAIGFSQDEIQEEWIPDENGVFKIAKRKIVKKNISPDISAARVLLSHFLSKEKLEFLNLTDSELESEKQRLLKLLEEEEKKNAHVEKND